MENKNTRLDRPTECMNIIRISFDLCEKHFGRFKNVYFSQTVWALIRRPAFLMRFTQPQFSRVSQPVRTREIFIGGERWWGAMPLNVEISPPSPKFEENNQNAALFQPNSDNSFIFFTHHIKFIKWFFFCKSSPLVIQVQISKLGDIRCRSFRNSSSD